MSTNNSNTGPVSDISAAVFELHHLGRPLSLSPQLQGGNLQTILRLLVIPKLMANPGDSYPTREGQGLPAGVTGGLAGEMPFSWGKRETKNNKEWKCHELSIPSKEH